MFSRGDRPAGQGLGLCADQVTIEGLMALEFAPALPQEIPSLSLALRPGLTATRAAGQGHMIRELRPFADGDDPRFLDAAASARSGSPHIRSFHEDREGNLLLIADFRRPMFWGSKRRFRSVAAAEILMRLGWQAMSEGGAVGLVTITDGGLEVTRPRARHAGLLRVASHLARVHDAARARPAAAQGGAELDNLLAGALRHAPPGAMVALATGLDRPGPSLHGVLAALCRRGPAALLLIEDPLELAPPAQALPCREPGAQHPRLLSLADLPAARIHRAEELRLPGLRLARIAADHLLEASPR